MTDFWRNLTGPDMELNLHGDPPYNVTAVAFEVCSRLNESTHPTFLEIGSGLRRLASEVEWVNREGAFVIGVDVNPECTNMSSLSILVDGTGTLPFDDGWFDGAYSVTVFQHLPEEVQRRYLVELARVVKPGGRIVIQHVCGDERGPQSRQVAGMEWLDWCDEAGLLLLGSASDPFQPDWTWFTMEIPA